jgi:phage tail-like protein
VRALRVYYPRFSYLQNYLPACYRDDVQSASLVERLLANHEGLVTAVEDRALSLGTLFDPAATPAEFLDWLGLWYAAYLDPAWPPLRKRLFLRHAMTFFQWRGTSRGLRAALRLAFDDCIDDALFTEAGDRDAEAQRYRVTEDFRVRSLPTEVPPPTSDCPGVCDRAAEPLFQASEGREALDRRWRLATSAATGEYPLSSPAGSEAAWSAFSLATLGFVPRSSAADAAAWGRFLRCRHRTFDEARGAWSSVFDAEWDSFHDVTLPTALPDSESALADWLVFNRVVLPMRASAHRFTVSLPVSPSRARDAELLRVQLHLADRLVMLEKPSQTAYRVQLYWALFRVGEARLGSDTELGQGSRLPELLPPLVLGEGALAEGRLAPRPEDRNRGRFELGRNPLRAGPRNRRNDPSGDFETS